MASSGGHGEHEWTAAVRPLLSASYTAFETKELPLLIGSIINRYVFCVTQLRVSICPNTGCVDLIQLSSLANLTSEVRWEALSTKLTLAASS